MIQLGVWKWNFPPFWKWGLIFFFFLLFDHIMYGWNYQSPRVHADWLILGTRSFLDFYFLLSRSFSLSCSILITFTNPTLLSFFFLGFSLSHSTLSCFLFLWFWSPLSSFLCWSWTWSYSLKKGLCSTKKKKGERTNDERGH